MSHQAIVWALAQPVKPAPAKHILTVLAHYVSAKNNGPWIAFPSVSQLVKDTGQDRKTVLVNIKRLLDAGYIVDTGERSGVTNSVPVYRLGPAQSSTENGTSKDPLSSTENGTPSGLEAVPNTGHLSSTEFPGAVPDFPISSTENGTAYERESSTKFPGKQYQNPPEAVPDFPTEQVEKKSISRVCARTRTRGGESPPPLTQTEAVGEDGVAQKRSVQIAVLLRRNGACYRTHAGTRGIEDLVEIGATDVQLLNALETAKQRRESVGSSQPITPAYLVPIVRELQAPAKKLEPEEEPWEGAL